MTREEAIADIRDNIKPVVGGKSLDMAIKALEQDPRENAISRQDALDCLTATGLKKFDFILDARDKIKNLSSVTPQPKAKEKWIWDGNKYICSKCGHFPWRITTEEYDEAFEDLSRENAYKFCPSCGAKMESEV